MKEQIEAVQRMQDYINNHLFEKITLTDLSKVSLFSPWYSHRIFLEFTKKTPADYIRRLRLSKSALKLRDENCKIVDVAFEYGFGSVDGYQRAFLKEFGCNPKEYSKNPVPLFKSISGEPVCMWLPKSYILPGTSEYVQGVEVELDYEEAINEIWQSIKKYDPSFIGYKWDDENPRIQLEPIGERGYIELMPIK